MENNQRIENIQAELELPIQTYTPEMDVWEKPEMAFIVKDEEVQVKRVLTARVIHYKLYRLYNTVYYRLYSHR